MGQKQSRTESQTKQQTEQETIRPVSLRSTPEERIQRNLVVPQKNDFLKLYGEIKENQVNYIYVVSDRIRNGLTDSGILPFTQEIFQMLIAKLTDATNLPYVNGTFDSNRVRLLFHTLDESIYLTIFYQRSINEGDTLDIFYRFGNNYNPQIIKNILNVFSNLSLRKKQHKFAVEKLSNRIGERIGLDPYASQKLIGNFLRSKGGKHKGKKTRKMRKTRSRV